MIEFRRGAERAVTRTGGVETRHSFSFGAHYDPTNTGFGALVACNEETLAAGAGFGPHEHRGLEVVTWVLEGVLRHEDDHGHSGAVLPGQVQLMRSGTGVVHVEANASGEQPVRFVQMWLVSQEPDRAPSYEVRDVPAGPGLVEAVVLPSARLFVGTAPLTVPAFSLCHVMVTRGQVSAGGPGDAVRLRDEEIEIEGAGELLVWDLSPG